MKLNEITISKAIINRYWEKLIDNLESDVAIVGGGPAGIVTGYYLSKAGYKVVMFERKLSIGGGMWGGGMLFNEIVVQDCALPVLDEMGVEYKHFEDNCYTAGAVETVSTMLSKAVKAGMTVFNCISVEDVMMRENRITGLVINWSPVEMAGLHVDPLTVGCKYVVEATGHPVEVLHCIERKVPGELSTPSGKIEGEKSMWAEKAESQTVENTREIFPGVYVAGMAANAAFGAPRMGPIFGGMLLSGKFCAEEIIKKLS